MQATEEEYAAAERAIVAAFPDRTLLEIQLVPTKRGTTIYAGKPLRLRAIGRSRLPVGPALVEAAIAMLRAE